MSSQTVKVDPCLSWAKSLVGPIVETTIRDAILENANLQSNKLAVISDHEGISKSFRQLFTECITLAESLVTRVGLSHGDHVAIATGSCYNQLVAFLACAIKGLVIWYYDPSMAANELTRFMDTAKPSAIFTMGLGSSQHSHFPKMAATIDWLHGMGVPIVAIDGKPYNLTSCWHIDDLMTLNHDITSKGQLTKPTDPLVVMTTSGSTGAPKMIVWSNRNFIAGNMFWYSNINLNVADKLCSPLSVHHGYSHVVLTSLLFSGHQVILTGYRYSLKQTISCLLKYDCNYVALVPTMLHDILHKMASDELKLKLTNIISCGAPLSPKMCSVVKVIFPNITFHQFYSMSEMDVAHIVSQDSFDSVGKPSYGVEVKIVDDKGQIVPHGQDGRLLVHSRLGMTGYLKPCGNIDTSMLDDDGYFDTGDLVKMDAQGYIFYQGRVKDVINRGGFKVSPKEVEYAILSVAGVLDCVVLGIPDTRLGEEIVAVVQVDSECDLSESDLMALTSSKISKLKLPRKFHVSTEALPRLSNSKCDKQALRLKMLLE